jgi:Cu2+-exporting ATPase
MNAAFSLPSKGTRVGHFRVVHALPTRLRLRSAVLVDPAFDSTYFQALLEALPGVHGVSVNTRARSVAIQFDGTLETWDRVAEHLRDVPQDVFLPDRDMQEPVTLGNILTRAGLLLVSQFMPHPARAVISWGMCLGDIVTGVETLVTRGVKVEVLDATAITLSLLRRSYFTAGAISTLLALGEHLEGRTEDRSVELLRSLLRPRTEEIWVIRDGVEVSLPLEEVEKGDLVVFGVGELISIDGTVHEGEASVNQSSVTGESAPVHIRPGDAVISGSVVEDGRLVVRVERVGSETSMARMTRFIDQSLRGRSKTQSKSSELADRLVPITFGLGTLVGLVTRDLTKAASVLTVDFSCAIKLAGPIVVRSNMYAAGQAGVLLKGADALDALLDVDTVVFDKTGTLTTGRLDVTDIVPLGMTEDALLQLAAGAEEHYDHPVARAVVREAKKRGLELPPISRVDFIVAHGVSAIINDTTVLVGSHHFIAEDEAVPCAAVEERAHELREQGKSLLYVAQDGKLVGIIALRDDPRPEAAEVLTALKNQGISRIVVLTGDHRETALALARHLPQIDDIRYELRPDDKAAAVAELKKEGRILAYVGDGVNDAPALVSAHVGISMPAGADLAKEAAQVILLSEDLHTLVIAGEAARRTNLLVRRCFAATISFNSLTMLLAMAGLPPVGAAILHNASTVGTLAYAAAAGCRSLKSTAPALPSSQEAPC